MICSQTPERFGCSCSYFSLAIYSLLVYTRRASKARCGFEEYDDDAGGTRRKPLPPAAAAAA